MFSLISLFIFFSVFHFVAVVDAVAVDISPHPTAGPVSPPQPKTYSKDHQWWHAENINQPQATLLSAAFISFFGAAGWIAVHALTLRREELARKHADRREKEVRRAELLATLHFWRQTLVVETDPAKLKHLYYFGGAMKELSAAAARFYGWANDKARFEELNYVSNMNPESLDAKGVNARRDTVCGALNTFIQFVREA